MVCLHTPLLVTSPPQFWCRTYLFAVVFAALTATKLALISLSLFLFVKLHSSSKHTPILSRLGCLNYAWKVGEGLNCATLDSIFRQSCCSVDLSCRLMMMIMMMRVVCVCVLETRQQIFFCWKRGNFSRDCGFQFWFFPFWAELSWAVVFLAINDLKSQCIR